VSVPVRLVRRFVDEDARFRLHQALTAHAVTHLAYEVVQPKIRGLGVRRTTELVIEGFPRSANTYAVAAFRCVNGPEVVVADHLHAATSITRAARRGVPAIVLVRDPLDACASLIQRQRVTPVTALTAYVRFHAGIDASLDRVVVSDFDTTTQSFGTVITAVNDRFGTSFVPYERTPENEAWCRAFVVEADRLDQGSVGEATVALPQASRQEAKQSVVQALERERALVASARAGYERVRAHAVH
jgi:hypothetical protein